MENKKVNDVDSKHIENNIKLHRVTMLVVHLIIMLIIFIFYDEINKLSNNHYFFYIIVFVMVVIHVFIMNKIHGHEKENKKNK